jgi:hypothetical protein
MWIVVIRLYACYKSHWTIGKMEHVHTLNEWSILNTNCDLETPVYTRRCAQFLEGRNNVTNPTLNFNKSL